MDGPRFDALVRSLALSRRQAAKGVLAAAATLVGLRAETRAARRGYSGPNFTGCTIGGTQYAAGSLNPGQECQVCAPLTSNSSWSARDDGSTCSAGACCSGSCCAGGRCCDAGICGDCGCLIDGQHVAQGALNPNNPCESCEPDIDPTGWSIRSNSATCDADGFHRCCEGTCCEYPGDSCRDGACWPGFCIIDGVVWEDQVLNPLNECQWCAAPLTVTSWVNRQIGQPCGDNQVCCNGECLDDC